VPLTPSLLAELVRLPALLSVPGDALVGSAAARSKRGALQMGSSALLYSGGMALNDYADRLVDALERPGRPIPSGRIAAVEAKAVATGLIGGGVGLAGVLGGRRALRVAVPLAATVWAYDTRAKSGPRGPALMAACRGLDVLLGASPGRLLPALPAAAVVAGHTANVTALSQHEIDGAPTEVAARARRGALVVAAAPVVLAAARRDRRGLLVAIVGSTLYAAQCLPALQKVGKEPASVQRAVGANVLGLVPLQAALLAASGAPRRGLALLPALALARRASRRRRVT
jgi:hypothetical protein